ncbi:MAG: hypothetical protein HY558_02205 [Euryarchaeota archaeon]|nr:hypothetical protein [Euryarchaeota archaeon]
MLEAPLGCMHRADTIQFDAYTDIRDARRRGIPVAQYEDRYNWATGRLQEAKNLYEKEGRTKRNHAIGYCEEAGDVFNRIVADIKTDIEDSITFAQRFWLLVAIVVIAVAVLFYRRRHRG